MNKQATPKPASDTATAFDWRDPFFLDDQLEEDERMIRDTAAAFAETELRHRIEDMYMNETADPEIFRLMGDTGLLGVTIPEEYGGVGANYVAYGLVAREIERSMPSDRRSRNRSTCRSWRRAK